MGGGGGKVDVLHAVFVGPSTMRPREDRALFGSEQSSMVNRSFLHCQMWLKFPNFTDIHYSLVLLHAYMRVGGEDTKITAMFQQKQVQVTGV